MTIHKTNPVDAAVHESGWVRVGDVEVTAVPLVDLTKMSNKGEHLFARLTYEDALKVAARLGARLVKMSDVEAVRDSGVQLKPYLGTPIAENTIEHSLRHDDDIWKQLVALGWDRKSPVCGAGKHWLHDAPPGKSRLGGWDKDGPGPSKAWWQPDSVAHNRMHFDDGTTTMLARAPRGGLGSRIAGALSGAVSWLVSGLRPTLPLVAEDLGEATLAEALADIDAGVRETQGPNRSPEIDAYNKALGVPLGSSWCATSLTCWMRRAAKRLGVKPPIDGSAGAKNIMVQLQKAGRWLTSAEIRANPKLLRPGMVYVWHRGAPGAWTGHTGLHKALLGGLDVETAEGNSGAPPFGNGDRAAVMRRRLDDPLLLGAGWLD